MRSRDRGAYGISRRPSLLTLLSSLSRPRLIESTVETLASYRLNTDASQSPKGQLILPEALKILPLYALSTLKSHSVRASRPRGGRRSDPPSPRADFRCAHLQALASAPPRLALALVHPSLYSVLDMPNEAGLLFTPETPPEGEAEGGDEMMEVSTLRSELVPRGMLHLLAHA